MVEIVVGKGRGTGNVAYIHRYCSYDVLAEGPRGDDSLDVFSLLVGVTDPTRGLEDLYWDLREFFRLCEKPPITMTFQDIEKIIGFALEGESCHCKAFWFDEAPALAGELRTQEFSTGAVRPSQLASEYVISDAWRSQGFRIQRLDMTQEKATSTRKSTAQPACGYPTRSPTAASRKTRPMRQRPFSLT